MPARSTSDDGVAARHEVVVVEQRDLDDVAVRVVGLLLALVAAPAAGVVRAGVHDHGYLAALRAGSRGRTMSTATRSVVRPRRRRGRCPPRRPRGSRCRRSRRVCSPAGARVGGGRGEQGGHQGGGGRRRERSPGREAHAYRHAPDGTPVNSGAEEGGCRLMKPLMAETRPGGERRSGCGCVRVRSVPVVVHRHRYAVPHQPLGDQRLDAGPPAAGQTAAYAGHVDGRAEFGRGAGEPGEGRVDRLVADGDALAAGPLCRAGRSCWPPTRTAPPGRAGARPGRSRCPRAPRCQAR